MPKKGIVELKVPLRPCGCASKDPTQLFGWETLEAPDIKTGFSRGLGGISKTFTLFVMDYTGEKHSLDVSFSDSIADVKSKLALHSSMPSHHMRLAWNRVILSDSCTLSDYGIQGGQCLFLTRLASENTLSSGHQSCGVPYTRSGAVCPGRFPHAHPHRTLVERCRREKALQHNQDHVVIQREPHGVSTVPESCTEAVSTRETWFEEIATHGLITCTPLEPHEIHVQVREVWPGGCTRFLYMSSHERVLRIKHCLAALNDVSPDQQNLFEGGRLLDDHLRLSRDTSLELALIGGVIPLPLTNKYSVVSSVGEGRIHQTIFLPPLSTRSRPKKRARKTLSMSTCRSHASVQKHALPPRCLEDLSLHDGPRDQHLAVATLIDDVTEVPVQNPPRPLDILGKLTPETVRGNDLDGSSSTVVPEKVMIPVYDAHDRGVLPLCDLALAPTDSDSYLPECVDSFRESCGRRPSVHSAELPASSWECDTEVRPRVRDAVRVGTSEQQCEPQLDGIHTPLDACRGLDTQRSEVGAWWEHTRGVLTSVYRRCAPPLSGRHKLQHAITADDTDVSDSLGDSAQPSETDDHDELEVHTDDGRPLPVDWEGMRSEMAPFVNAQLCGHLKQTKAVLGVVYEACASRPPKSESPVHQAHPGGTLVDDTLDKEDPRFPVRRTDTIWEQSTATLVFVYERCAHY